ncbi:MAG: DUF4157 domain-containing protein [Edaphocola sp.]
MVGKHLSVKVIENSLIARMAAVKLGARSTALAFGNKIHLYGASKEEFLKHPNWVCHELVHVKQYRQHGFFNFLFKYFIESARNGYYHNKYEQEARAGEKDHSILNDFVIV